MIPENYITILTNPRESVAMEEIQEEIESYESNEGVEKDEGNGSKKKDVDEEDNEDEQEPSKKRKRDKEYTTNQDKVFQLGGKDTSSSNQVGL